jgi:glutamate-ammonia-ligase adenylyltransferase
MLLSLLDRCGGSDVDIIALGSYGAEELLLCSDWDVMLLAHGDDVQTAAERAGEEWMRVLRRIGVGSPLPVDVRLRPEGRSGLIVRSLSGLAEYANSAMEPWERLAYTRARSLRKLPESTDGLMQATYLRPWSTSDEAEAAHMRKRVHTERMQPSEAGRDLKLGPGSLFDIEWLTAVLKLRSKTSARRCSGTVASLKRLADENAITILERDTLTSAHELFSLLRNAMYLLELDSDSILPENPDKLARIAEWVKAGSANELLRIVDECHKEVQAVFESILGEESL